MEGYVNIKFTTLNNGIKMLMEGFGVFQVPDQIFVNRLF